MRNFDESRTSNWLEVVSMMGGYLPRIGAGPRQSPWFEDFRTESETTWLDGC